MTNLQIIVEAMQLNGIDPDTRVDTFAGWKRQGYRVKHGEKALFKTSIWKPSTKKTKDEKDAEKENDEQKYNRMYLVPAAFFSFKQVEEDK